MQVQGMAGTQTDFVSGTKNNEVNAADVQQQNIQETGVFGEQKESYQPSEEALLRFYYEQMKSEQQEKANASKEEQVDIIKLMRIAQNIMRGKQVPSKDESYLVKHNLSLYMAAKNIGSLREPSGKAKSVLNGNEKPASIQSGGTTEDGGVSEILETDSSTGGETILKSADGSSVTKTARQDFDISEYQAETERSYGSNSVSSSKTKKANSKKKYKKFRYNFKSVSSQVVKAKTSMSARQAAGRARRQTTDLRRKLVSGDYDRTYIQIALTHAEAIERVAKKKIRHLLEEERVKRGGPCSGNNDKFDREEQKKLDEQANTEMWNNFRDGKFGAESEGDNLVELFTEAVQQSAPAPEVSIDLDELMMEFEELMKFTMETAAEGLDDLTDELSGGTVEDMDPEDLKLLKIKHRSKEQQEIAEADARYLRAFFDKLQKDQEQTAAAISQIAEAAASMPAVQIADTGGGKAAAPAVESASSTPAVSTESAAEIADMPAPSANMKTGIGVNISPPTVSIDGASFDISI